MLRLIFFTGLFLFCAFSPFYINPWLALPGWIIGGIALHNIVFLGHDASHGTLVKNPELNAILGHLIFAPFFIDFDQYKRWHFKHHKYVGTKYDPELDIKRIDEEKYRWHNRKLRYWFEDLILGGSLYEVVAFWIAVNRDNFKLGIIYGIVFWYCMLIIFQKHIIPIAFFFPIYVFTSMWASFRLRAYWEHYCHDVLTHPDDEPIPYHTRQAKAPLYIKLLTVWQIDKHDRHHKFPYIASRDL